MNKYIILLIVSVLLFGACKDHFKVDPLTEVEESKQFSKKTGYYSSLYGVYLEMASYDMYGSKLRHYVFEDLAQTWKDVEDSRRFTGSNGMYEYETNSQIKNVMDPLWSKHYNLIANLNNLLKNLEDPAKAELFPEGNYELLIAEAKGLRALLHFNLVKIFAPSIASDENAFAIPYMDEFTRDIVAPPTVREFYNKIINDLEDAEALLKVYDPLLLAETEDEIKDALALGTNNIDDKERLLELGFRSNRLMRLNYYAVQALLAKVHLFANNKESAFLYAKNVLDTAHNAIQFSQTSYYPATTIFGLPNDRGEDFTDQIKSDFEQGRKLDGYICEDLFEIDILHSWEVDRIRWNDPDDIKALKQEVIDWVAENGDAVNGVYYKKSEIGDGYGTFLLREQGTYLEVPEGVGDNDFRWMRYSQERVGSTNRLINARWVGTTGIEGYDYFDIINHEEILLIAIESSNSPATQLQYLNDYRYHYELPLLDATDIDTEEKLDAELEKEYKKTFIGTGKLFFYFKRKNKSSFVGINGTEIIDAIENNIYVLPHPEGEGF